MLIQYSFTYEKKDCYYLWLIGVSLQTGLYKAMIQHILLHETTREVFLLLIHAKVITGLGTRQVELFLGEILQPLYSACFQHSKERS